MNMDETDESDILDETVDLSDAKLASRKRNKDEREKVEEEKLVRAILGERIGRRYLYKWLSTAGAFRDDFVVSLNGTPDNNMTYFKAGQKELGQRLLLSWMRIDFDSVKTMLDENDPRFMIPKRKRGTP
jgi:hypothetical protein